MPNILLAGSVHPIGKDMLDAHDDFSVRLIECDDFAQEEEALSWADAVLLRTQVLGRHQLELAKRLRFVARYGVGYDAVDVEALNERNIPLALVGTANAIAVAEHAMAFLLSATRRICQYDRSMYRGDWQRRNRCEGRESFGKNLFLLGYGRIGREVARLAQCFGMQCLVYDPYVSSEEIARTGAEAVENTASGFQRADYISLHMPAQDGVVIDREALSHVKPSAILINTARGSLIDEGALIEALDQDRLGLAALDVLLEEPAGKTHPLIQHPKVIVTPHVAGLSEECAERMTRVSCQNIIDYFKGELNPDLIINYDALSLH